jgi:hypothetical protein
VSLANITDAPDEKGLAREENVVFNEMNIDPGVVVVRADCCKLAINASNSSHFLKNAPWYYFQNI